MDGPLTALEHLDGPGVLAAAGIIVPPASVVAQPIRSGNVVIRLDTDQATFYLKAPAKDLEPWDDKVEGARAKVSREAAAAECLRRRGVASMDVLAVETGEANVLGRPYLLTRRVPGRQFTEIVPRGTQAAWEEPLEAVGAYLASVHRIEFDAAGYVVSAHGPAGPTPPAPVRSAHTPEAAQDEALQDLEHLHGRVDIGLLLDLEHRFSSMADAIREEYHPPRFVIGGFHPDHPFLDRMSDGLSVVGCVDLEVASGGRTLDDLVTFSTGMMFRFDGTVPWWEPLFDGYGTEPSIESVRTALLASCTYLFGDLAGLQATYRALIESTTWGELFNAHRRQ